MDVLQGRKTYLVAAVGIVVNVLAYAGILTAEQVAEANRLLVFLGLAAVRSALAK